MQEECKKRPTRLPGNDGWTSCPHCGKSPDEFQGGLVGLRCHVGQCRFRRQEPPMVLVEGRQLTRAAGLKRLWTVIRDMSITNRVSIDSTSVLSDCAAKLVKMMDDSQVLDKSDGLLSLAGVWTVSSLAALCLAILLQLKGSPARRSGEPIYCRAIQASGMVQLLHALKTQLYATESTSEISSINQNSKLAVMKLLLVLSREPSTQWVVGAAVIEDVLRAVQNTDKLDPAPSWLLCTAQVLLVLSENHQVQQRLHQLGAIALLVSCSEGVSASNSQWHEAINQLVERLSKSGYSAGATGVPEQEAILPWNRAQKRKLASRSAPNGRGAKTVCDVCTLPVDKEDLIDEWLQCSQCMVAVHIECYMGYSDIEPRLPWLCEWCAAGASGPCQICGQTGGALKPLQKSSSSCLAVSAKASTLQTDSNSHEAQTLKRPSEQAQLPVSPKKVCLEPQVHCSVIFDGLTDFLLNLLSVIHFICV